MSTSCPRTSPIRSVAELAAFDASADPDPFSRTTTPLARRKKMAARQGEAREVLVCHDFKGGYKEDAEVQGANTKIAYHCQYMQFWDDFVYFSHERVSIPPPTWTNTLHRNGIRVLGTIIFEWEQGAAEFAKFLRWPSGAPDAPLSFFLAEKLVEVAVYYGFDGWLFNVECHLPQGTKDAEDLQTLVAYLKSRMSETNPGSKVIWYDSVTVDGQLRWQNRLSPKNLPFFQACDGIFTNYTWQAEFPVISAQVAGESDADRVWMGIDVFGRNTFGGGGFDCHKALAFIGNASISAAIFAPGWTFESFTWEKFEETEERFWTNGYNLPVARDPRKLTLPTHEIPKAALNELHTILESRSSSGSIASYVPPRAIPGTDEFVISFNQGMGDHIFSSGKRVVSAAWHHLSTKGVSPTFRNLVIPLRSLESRAVVSSRYTLSVAYDGGSSLELHPRADGDSAALIPLLHCDHAWNSTASELWLILGDVDRAFSGLEGNWANMALQVHFAELPQIPVLAFIPAHKAAGDAVQDTNPIYEHASNFFLVEQHSRVQVSDIQQVADNASSGHASWTTFVLKTNPSRGSGDIFSQVSSLTISSISLIVFSRPLAPLFVGNIKLLDRSRWSGDAIPGRFQRATPAAPSQESNPISSNTDIFVRNVARGLRQLQPAQHEDGFVSIDLVWEVNESPLQASTGASLSSSSSSARAPCWHAIERFDVYSDHPLLQQETGDAANSYESSSSNMTVHLIGTAYVPRYRILMPKSQESPSSMAVKLIAVSRLGFKQHPSVAATITLEL